MTPRIMPVTAALLASGALMCGLAACSHDSTPDSPTEQDWSTPHTSPGQTVTGYLDLEQQAALMGRSDFAAEPVPGHPGWHRLTVRNQYGAAKVPASPNWPSFDFREMREDYTNRDVTMSPRPTGISRPTGGSGATVFQQDGKAIICLRFDAGGTMNLYNPAVGIAFVAPEEQRDDLERYVHGLAVTDPQSTRTTQPRASVALAYLGQKCHSFGASLARCADGTVPKIPADRLNPEIDLATFTPNGKTPQGYDYQLRTTTYQRCANDCRTQPVVMLWVRVPENAHGTHPAFFLTWFEDTNDDTHLSQKAHDLNVRA